MFVGAVVDEALLTEEALAAKGLHIDRYSVARFYVRNRRTDLFHDLRHSCASVLLAQGVPMKQIQEWLGHSDMSTTANIYSHLDAVTKADTGAAMSKALG